MKKFLFAALAAALAFCACSKEAETISENGLREVKFTVANLNTFNFKSTDPINGANPSTVGIYAAELGANNVSATVSGSALTPSSTIYWGVGQTTSSTFAARYPYASGATLADSYDIPADQTSADTFTYQDNFVLASATASPSDAAVAFAFAHPFAKVFVNITNNLGGDAVASVKLKGVKLNASAVYPAVTIDPAAVATDVLMYGVSATQFAAVILPQTALLTIEITTTQGSVYNFASASSYEFAAGSASAAAVTISPIGGSASGANRESVSAFSFSLTDWPNTPTDRTVAEGESSIGNYWHVIGCVYETANTETAWSKDFPMTLRADGKWEITVNYDETMAATNAEKGIKLRYFSSSTAAADKWNTNVGFYEGTGDDYTLASGGIYGQLHAGGKNIRLASAGSWTLVYNPAGTDDENPQLTVTKN